MDVRVEWIRQGKVHWEQHWLDQNGPVRTHLPDFEDHLKFVNHDLQSHRDPEVRQSPVDGALCIHIPMLDEAIIEILSDPGPRDEPLPGLVNLIGIAAVLQNHGFVLRPEAEFGVRSPMLADVPMDSNLYRSVVELIHSCAATAPELRFRTPEGGLS